MIARSRRSIVQTAIAAIGLLIASSAVQAQPSPAPLGRAEITLYGLGLKADPAVQTVPKGFATIVSTFLQGAAPPANLPGFSADAEVRATLSGPSFQTPLELTTRPNSPFNIPPLNVPGTHVLENIRLISGGDTLLFATPESTRIEVIDKLLVTTVTARPLTADEIREKGIVFDKTNFQAYNFTAAFAVDDGSKINIAFPVVLPTITGPLNVDPSQVTLASVDAPQLRSLQTLIPDTLQIQARIPNLSVVGFTLTLDESTASQNFYVPPIPGVIVIPGDIGFLNQFFSVMLMVANVAPNGSGLVVSDLTASIVLPPGRDNVVGSTDDPLAMARRESGEFPRVVPVTQAGPDGALGTADDITTLGPGETGNAEYLIEGRREGTHVVEMELAGTLHGLPIGAVPIRGRAAGAVLVRNPTFTLTFTHPEVVNAREPYTLDVTVTNTSLAPANFVSVNLFPANISGAILDDDSVKSVDSIAPGDSASVSFRLISNRTGKITAATLDSDDQVQGRFLLKTAVGELGAPLSPDSLVLPAEAAALPASLRQAAVDLLARAWAIATAPPAALPKDLTRFSKQIVLDRGVQTAEAGLRVSLGEPLPHAAASLLFDYLGADYTRLATKVPANDTTGLLALLQRDTQGFDLVRRRSIRGDLFADAIATELSTAVLAGAPAFHLALAEQMTSAAGHLSVLISASGSGALAFEPVVVDGAGHRLGGHDAAGKVVKDIPFGDVLTFKNVSGEPTAQLLVVAVPDPGNYTLQLLPRAGGDPAAPYDISVVLPGADGKLRISSLTGVDPSSPFNVTNGAADPQAFYGVRRDAAGAPATASLTLVNDPPPSILGVRQIGNVDLVGCPLDPERNYPAGRVVAVLFSEPVTPESVQDKAPAGAITTFRPESNRVVGVALQPGGRIAYVALRSPVGPFEQRMMTVDGAQDLNGNTIPTQTLPIVTTVGTNAGVVFGRVVGADGTVPAFSTVRMFYEFSCPDGGEVVGIAEQTTDAEGRYQFDYVLRAPGMNVKMVALNQDTEDIRTVRFVVARDSQRLNVDVVFLGRGSLTGRVLAEDGRTILPGTVLRATSLTDQSQYGATADATGTYMISGIPVGNVLVEAVNTDRPASLFVSENIPFAGATVERNLVLLDVNTNGPTIEYGAATGRVLRADGTTGVPGIPVIAYYKNRSQPDLVCPVPPGGQGEPAECAVQVVNTDDQGRFAFPHLPVGEIRVNTFDQTTLQQGNVRIAVAENQTFAVSILLGGGYGTVHGVVLDASHNPVPDAVIGGGASLVNAGADGSFTLTDIPVGRTRLVAVSNAVQSQGESFVDIVANGEAVNTTIVLDPVGSVAGIVRDHDGVPQAGIKVWVFQDCYDEQQQPSICVKGQATTDAQGAYRIDKLGVAQYRISAFRNDLKDGNVFPIAIRFERQVLIADITFRGGFGTVKGRVLRAESCATPPCGDTPLAAKVSISGDRLVVAGGKIGVKFEYVQNFKIVDNDPTTGAYEFKDSVFTGPFTVRAAGQFSPEPVAAEGTMPGPGQTVTIDLRLQPTSRITGTVLEPDGFTPVTGRPVALTFKSNAVVVFCSEDASTGDSECTSIPQGIQEAFAAIDAQGHFSFPIVNAGPFTIAATDTDGHRVAEVKGTVRAGEEIDLPIRLLGRAPVTVRVFRSNGVTPVVGASVEIQGLDYPKEHRPGVTGPDGTVLFGGGDAMSEGQFVVTAMDQSGFAGRKSGRVIADGIGVTVDVFLFDATGTVSGVVKRADATSLLVPVPNAEVILSNGSGPLAYALTDANGVFSVALIPTGPITAEAFDPVTAGRGRATGVVLGAQETQLTLTLESLGSIRGTVMQSGTLTPLKGWTVSLDETTFTGRGLPTQLAQTGVDGSFAFPGASVGNFVLRAFKRDIVGQTSANGQVTRGGQLVDVPMVVSIERRVTGSVTGAVVGGGGVPAPNPQVEVCASEGCRATAGGPDGRFSIADIPLGRFTVRASAQVTGNPSVGTTGGVLLFEGDTADVTITLLGLSTIEGTVFETVNNVQTPVPNATVRLFGQPGSGCPGACQQGTDAQGHFSFINVPAQTFTVVASSLNGQQGSVGDVLTPGEAKTGLRIVIAPAVTLTGRALLGSAPAPGVVADLTLNGGHLFAETDADGRFSYEALGAGNYSLLLQDPIGAGIARRSGPVNLSGPMDLGDIVLDATPPAVVSSVPAAGAIGVSRTPEIRVLFTEPLSAGTVNPTTVTLTGPSGVITGQIDLITGDTEVRFRLLPGSQLVDQARYTLRVTGVQDLAGHKLPSDFILAFTTVDVSPPSITETTPGANGSGVSVDSVIRVKYSEIIDPSKFNGAPIQLSGPQGAIAGRTDYLFSNTVIVFTPNLPLAEDSQYTVAVQPATDLTGLTQPAATSFAFTTTDRTPPVITALAIAGGPTIVENTIGHATAQVATTDVAVVDFFVNGTFVFAARTVPFRLDFQALASFAGPGNQIKVSAVATDTSGNRGTVPVDEFVTLVPDQPPAVTITEPLSTFAPAPGERVNVSVRATDDVGVKSLTYSARGLVVLDAATRSIAPPSTDRIETFGFNVPLDALPGSTITIQASATDTGDHVVQAAAIDVKVRDAVGPIVQITGVSSGQRVVPGAHVTAVVSASDSSGVAKIGFAVSGITSFSEERLVTPAQNAVATSFEFTVPADATSTDRVFLDAFAVDGNGNRTDAVRLIVPVADRQAPTLTLRTSTGSLAMVPGGTVAAIVDATDDLAIASVQLTGTGAFAFSETQTPPAPVGSFSPTFTLNIPNSVAEGATETLTARTTDASGNVSVPVTLTLTAHAAAGVSLPSSVLMLAGDQQSVTVTLASPAPAEGVTVDLLSQSPGIATVTTPVVFAAGEMTKSVTVRAISGGSALIDALVSGTPRASMTVTVSGGVVRGDVTVAQGGTFVPVAGAQITVFHGGAPITTMTGADGRFVVEGVHGADFLARNFSISATEGNRLDFESFQLDVPNGSASVSLNLLEMGIIKGTVYQPDVVTEAGAGAKVDLFEAASSSVSIATTFTDADGNYQFPLVAPGPYIIEATDASGNRGRAVVQLNSGEQLFTPVVYLGRGTVTVHVVNGVGSSVSGADVQLNASSIFGGAPARTGSTDGSGSVTFANVFVGQVSATGHDPATNQGGSASGQLTADGQTLTLDVQFAQYGNLTGTIFRRDGTTKVPGAQVTADFGPFGRFTTSTDVNGVYRFDFLPFRSFTLTVLDAATRGRAIDSGTFTTSGQTLLRNETLLPQGALLVTVVDADGQPVNGATVTAVTQTQSLTDSLQGVTTTINTAGQVLLDRLLAGSFTVTASAAGLNGSATGVLSGDEVHLVTVQLEARASIALNVFEPDGQTPAAGSARVIHHTTGQLSQGALVNGVFTADNLKLGTYDVEAYDSAGRFRAFANALVLSSNGQTLTPTLTFVGLGTVQGRVIHPTGGDVGNLTVSLHSLNPSFGGFANVQTDAAGNYAFGGIAIGAVSLSAGKTAEQLLGEASGAIAQHNQTITLDILLEANAVALPTSLNDVQDSSYGIAQNGGLTGGTGNVFQRGGSVLTITSNGSSVPFTGAGFGTREDGGREIAVRQTDILGLNVTRKIAVPANGYFARYLEILQNPTSAPISVDLSVTSRPYGQRTAQCCIFNENPYFVTTTSSGDTLLDVSSAATADQWVSLGVFSQDAYYDFNSGVPLGIVFAGPGGAKQASTATFGQTLLFGQSVPTVTYGWSGITVPANGTVVVMHFTSEEADVPSATAAAQRLVQLPPEALTGLSAAEIAGIVNFVVPANGVSALSPLPAVNGTVNGRVLEGDGLTPVPGAHLVLKSTIPVLARQRRLDADGNGAFSISGGAGHVVPIADFNLTARHTINQYTFSPTITGTFGAGQTTVTQDVIFTNQGILKGVVRRTSGAVVAGASVEIPFVAFYTTGADGRFFFGGVSGSNLLVRGTLNHPQGTGLTIVPQTFSLAAGQVRDEVLLVEPTGTVTGTIRDANEAVQVNRSVTLTRANFSRFATTDSAGRFTFGDVPVGSFTITTTDPDSGFPVTQQVALAQDETKDSTLHYLGKGSITVNVTRANGTPLPGVSVSVSAPNVNSQSGSTGAGGAAGPFNNLPLGQTYTITAAYPDGGVNISISSALRTTTTLTLNSSSATTTLALPAFGTVLATVTRPNGTLPGQGFSVSLQNSGGGAGFFSQGTTGANSQINLGVVPVGRPFIVRTVRPPTVQFGPQYQLTTAPLTLDTDAQAFTLTTHLPAVAKLAITVKTAGGTPIPNAQVDVRDAYVGGFQTRGTTDASGLLNVNEVPEGAFAVRVFQPGTTTVLELVTGQVTAGDDGTTMPVLVTPKSFAVTVTGRITENDGTTGLRNISLQLLRAVDLQFLASTCSRGPFSCVGDFPNPADLGTFVFGPTIGNPPAPLTSTGAGFVLRAFSPAESKSYDTPIVPAADGTINVTVSLPFFTVSLEGHVYASDGVTTVGDGVIFPVTLSGRSGLGITVSPDGSYHFSPAPYPIEGMNLEYNLTGLPNGKYTTPTIPFTQSGQIVNTDIVLPASVVTKIRGTVVAGDGVTPLPNAQVDLVFPNATCGSNFGGCSTSTNAQGAFELFAALPADGQFTVRAHSPRTFSITAEISSSNTAQGATVNVGNVTLPISLLSGVATNGVSTPVSQPTAFVTAPGFSARFADRTDADGSFVFYELPAATYHLTVQNTDAATDASVDLALATATSVVSGVQVVLPPVARVEVSAVGPDGQPTDQATIALTRQSGGFERIQYGPDSGNTYVFPSVALDTYTLQGSLETCDTNGDCQTLVAGATLAVDHEGTVTATLSFAALAQARIVVEDLNGVAHSSIDVDVTVQSLAAAGPLGVPTIHRSMTTDAQGLLVIDQVPEGPYAVRLLTQNYGAGVATGTAAATNAPVTEVVLSYDAFEQAVNTYRGFQIPNSDRVYVFGQQADLRDVYRVVNGQGVEGGAFHNTMTLQLQGQSLCCPIGGNYAYQGAEVVFAPVASTRQPGVVVTRRMRILQGGNYARVLDTLTNTTSSTKTFTVGFQTAPWRSSSFGPESTPSPTTGGYFVRSDSSHAAAAFGVVYAGVNPPTVPSLVVDDGFSMFVASSTITLTPGQSMSFLNFLVVRPPDDVDGVTAQVQAISTLSDPDMLTGLTRDDILPIVNFRITPPPPGPATVRVTVVDPDGFGTGGASVALVAPGVTLVKHPYEDNFGVYEFFNVPPGTYAVQASIDGCDDLGCRALFTEAPVTVSADQTATVHLSFTSLGRAVVTVVEESGLPRAFDNVDVEIQSVAAVGPFGSYHFSYNANLDEHGQLTIERLPPGQFLIRVFSWNISQTGVAQGIATRFTPAAVQVQLSPNTVDFQFSALPLIGADNFYYLIDRLGQLSQTYFIDNNLVQGGALSYAAQLHSGGDQPLCCSFSATPAGREWTLSPMILPASPGVIVTRRVQVPAEGGFLRFFDLYTNTSATTQVVPASMWTQFAADTILEADVTPSSTSGGYFARSDGSQQATSIGVVYAGVNPQVPVQRLVSDDATTIEPTTALTLLPGQSLALLQYVVQRAPDAGADAAEAARQLSTLEYPHALAGLSRDDMALVMNFRITPPPPGPATIEVKVFEPGGTVTNLATVALLSGSYSAIRQPFEDTNGTYVFSDVPEGAYSVHATFEACSGCDLLFSDASVTAAADETASVVLSFANLGQTTLTVLDQDGFPLAGDNVDITIQSLSASSPLGSFQRSLNVNLDGQGRVTVDQLPPGRFVVLVHSFSRDARASAIAQATPTVPSNVTLQLSDNVSGMAGLLFVMAGADNFFYFINSDASIEQGFYFDGTNLVQGGGFTNAAQIRMAIDGAPAICCPLVSIAVDREVRMSPVPVQARPGVTVERRLVVPEPGRFIRILDVFTNSSGSTQTLPVSLWTTPVNDTLFEADVIPSLTTGGYFARSDAAQPPQSAAFGLVYAGVNPAIPVERRFSDDLTIVQPTMTLTLAPGQSAALMHFVLLRAPNEGADVTEAARVLSTLEDPLALTGLSPEDLALIANFRVLGP